MELDRLQLPLTLEDPQKLHLTLNFLGRVEEAKIGSIGQLIKEVAQGIFSFYLTPSYLDCMYKKHASSFIYLGLSGDLTSLKQMQKSLTHSISRTGIPQPNRFFPHITIARFKKSDPVTTKRAMDQVADFEFAPLDTFPVTHISLFESLLSSKGSHYRRIGQYPLK